LRFGCGGSTGFPASAIGGTAGNTIPIPINFETSTTGWFFGIFISANACSFPGACTSLSSTTSSPEFIELQSVATTTIRDTGAAGLQWFKEKSDPMTTFRLNSMFENIDDKAANFPFFFL
jgi:hypothetical protein